MARRMYKKCTTPSEVFQECLLDIRDGLWVCGELSLPNTTCTQVEKPMGCALGLVGINTGECQWTLERNAESDYVVFPTWPNDRVQNWDRLAQECVQILAEAAVIVSDEYAECVADNEDLMVKNEVTGGLDMPPLERIVSFIRSRSPNGCEPFVITMNDDFSNPKVAAEWFSEALKIAQKRNG
jgi:hypothetical protein